MHKCCTTFNRTNGNVEWAWWTWNPVTGCKHGCKYCYARDIANRFSGGFEPQFHERRLAAPYNTKEPKSDDNRSRNVFLVSMGDLWGEWVPAEWIQKVLDVCRDTPQFNYLALTKNPERYREFDIPRNVWTGATADTQERIEAALSAFENLPTTNIRFLSCEPLLEPLKGDLGLVDCVIIGGQSRSTGDQARQPEWAWAESLFWQARKGGAKVYWKPNLEVRPKEMP